MDSPLVHEAIASINQEARLWFEEWQRVTGRDGAPFHVPLALDLIGPLDVDALRAVVDTLVARHDAFRTSFHVRRGDSLPSSGHLDEAPWYWQEVADRAELPLRIVDLTDATDDERQALLVEFTQDELVRRFDYTQPPLARATLYRLGPEQHALVFVLHHLVTDGWSLAVLRRELELLYEQQRSGRPSRALAATVPRGLDFAIWQRERLRGPVLEDHLAFWRRQTDRWGDASVRGDDLPFARRPTRPRPGSAAAATLAIDGPRTRALRALGSRCNVTQYVVCLTALQAVLRMYTGRTSIALRLHFSNRMSRAFDHAIGWLATRHPLGADVEPDRSGLELIAANRVSLLDAFAHQEMPSSILWNQVMHRALRDGSPMPDLNASELLTFDVVPDAPFTSAELRVARLVCHPRRIAASMALTVVDHGAHLSLRAVYNTERFDQQGVAGLLSEWRDTLSRLVASPHDRLVATTVAASEVR